MKHSKYKNTGLIFELLTRQITSDSLAGINSKAVGIIKNYFFNTELGKEYKLYELLTKYENKLSDGKAQTIVSTLLEHRDKLNKTNLKRQKYNLIKEIKKHYDLDSFFKIQTPNYRAYASLYILLENENLTPSNEVLAKTSLLEHLKSKDNKVIVNESLELFKNQDKDTRILAYRVLLDKFNSKYKELNENQKRILAEYINNNESNPKLLEFYNKEVTNVKKLIEQQISKTKDKVVSIKLKEINSLLCELNKSDKIKDSNILNLLKHYLLIEELVNEN